jgi:phosphohistidine swiveling domain-containing protein
MSEEILWTSGFINERFPAPVSPLGWSLVGAFIEELALRDPLRFLGYPHAETIPLTRLWRGHPYVNVEAFQIIYKIFPDFILPEDAYRYFPDGDVALRKRASYPRWYDLPRFFLSLLYAFFSDPFNVSPLNNYRHWEKFTRKYDAGIAKLRARVDAMTNADPREIFAVLREVEALHRGVLRIHRWSLLDADLSFGLLRRFVGGERAAQWVADVPNKTLEVDADLRSLPREQFLAKHGHRSFSLDIAAPTFAEEPGQVERLTSMIDERQMTKDEGTLSSFVFRPSSGFNNIISGLVLPLARRYVALREDQRYYWQKSLAVSRRLYLMLADHLLADGVIGNRSQVFYATHLELQNYFDDKLPKADVARLISARQVEWREYQREFEQSPTESYPAFLRGGVPVADARRSVGRRHISTEWRGRAVSPGIARGVARIVQSASELVHIQPGEILIAPATDPAWTPVFARIAGLVVERGGVLSHSAVVAREYHIPAVAGIIGIVNAIKNGEMIEVDGGSGIVRRVQ